MRALTTKALSRWIVAGTLFIAGACAPISQAAVGSPDNNPANSPDRVLAFGFEMIQDRYLTDVNIGNVAFEGLKGLSAIDPALIFERPAPGRVLFRYRDDHVAEYPAPADSDPDGWASLIMAIARDAAAVSPELRKVDDEKIYEAVFDATLAKLDIFSRYAGAAEAREHRAFRNGFGGVGVRYQVEPQDIVLTEVMPETPAAEARLAVGDHVSAIDRTSLAGLSQNEISKRLRGPIDSAVALTVSHGGNPQSATVTLHRGLIVPPTVTMTTKDGIATIAITGFNQNTAASATEYLRQAEAMPNFKGVILDLRGNPGGLLDQGVAVAGLFMTHGRIVSTRGRHPASLQVYDAAPDAVAANVPLVVLVDGRSASAAEIVTAALQDSGRAVVVGTNSYGKGTVQTVIRMPNDGEMTLTWSRFYSPSGYALHGLGVLPTICTADVHAQPAALLAPVRDGHSPVSASIATWRASTIDETAERAQLRASCPAAKQGDVALDGELARQLILDHGLYVHALSLTAPVSTASSASTALSTSQH